MEELLSVDKLLLEEVPLVDEATLSWEIDELP
jgi:hypothetical protein